MKKIISLALCVIITITSLSIVSVSAKPVKNNYKVSTGSLYGDELLYVGGKYIFSTLKGIYVKKSCTAKLKKVVGRKWLDVLKTSVVSDGKKAYFIAYGPENYWLMKTNLKKGYKRKCCLPNMSDNQFEYFITLYHGKAYFLNMMDGKIYQITISNGRMKCISKKHSANNATYHNGYIYFSNDSGALGERSTQNTWRINLRNNKISKVLSKTNATDFNPSPNKISLWKYDEKSQRDGYMRTKNYIYTIGTNNKKVKSKQLPDKALVEIVDSKGKYAIFEKNTNLYKFMLKTGKKYKLSSIGYHQVKADMKHTKSLYFIKDIKKITVKKLKGNKLVSCKINGKKSISAGTDCWVSAGYLFVSYKGSKLKTYKLSCK